MPAKFIRSYQYVAPDGAQFPTLEEEMVHELEGDGLRFTSDMAQSIVSNRQAIIAILRQKERRHASPAAKTPRKRKDKPVTTTTP